jgi:hypothetical protein
MADSNVRVGKDWRELCAAASEESDSEKLASLVDQILRAFDEDECDRESVPSRLPVATTQGDARGSCRARRVPSKPTPAQ